MKKNKFFQIFGLIFLVYLSVTGQYLANSNYKEYAWLIGLFIIIVLSIEMMIVPFIVRLFNKERLDIKKGKLVCSWNSIIAFILSFALLAHYYLFLLLQLENPQYHILEQQLFFPEYLL